MGRMQERPTLVAATLNPGKLAEMRRLLASVPVELVGLEGFAGYVAPDESGCTYLENARIKALHAARATGLGCFADDSGLEVDALGGAPGIRSARFDGDRGTPASRNAKLLALLGDVPEELRTARFRAVVVLVEPGPGFREHVFSGVLEGRIAAEPSGEGGFGYDPIFVVPSLGVTVASLPPELKDALSHRGQAVRAMAEHLTGRSAARAGR
jgi:XTP/dITP diphosphohydrolase